MYKLTYTLLTMYPMFLKIFNIVKRSASRWVKEVTVVIPGSGYPGGSGPLHPVHNENALNKEKIRSSYYLQQRNLSFK